MYPSKLKRPKKFTVVLQEKQDFQRELIEVHEMIARRAIYNRHPTCLHIELQEQSARHDACVYEIVFREEIQRACHAQAADVLLQTALETAHLAHRCDFLFGEQIERRRIVTDFLNERTRMGACLVNIVESQNRAAIVHAEEQAVAPLEFRAQMCRRLLILSRERQRLEFHEAGLRAAITSDSAVWYASVSMDVLHVTGDIVGRQLMAQAVTALTAMVDLALAVRGPLNDIELLYCEYVSVVATSLDPHNLIQLYGDFLSATRTVQRRILRSPVEKDVQLAFGRNLDLLVARCASNIHVVRVPAVHNLSRAMQKALRENPGSPDNVGPQWWWDIRVHMERQTTTKNFCFRDMVDKCVVKPSCPHDYDQKRLKECLRTGNNRHLHFVLFVSDDTIAAYIERR